MKKGLHRPSARMLAFWAEVLPVVAKKDRLLG
jgi:hypothetical protein